MCLALLWNEDAPSLWATRGRSVNLHKERSQLTWLQVPNLPSKAVFAVYQVPGVKPTSQASLC